MKKNNKSIPTFMLTFGIIGTLAGIFLIFGGNKLIGISGSIASASLAIKGYSDYKKNEN